MVGQRNPMYSVLLLIGSFLGAGRALHRLDSPFMAVTQIIVYAGAIMVLFLFVVMLLNAPREDVARRAGLRHRSRPARAGPSRCCSVVLVVELVLAMRRS